MVLPGSALVLRGSALVLPWLCFGSDWFCLGSAWLCPGSALGLWLRGPVEIWLFGIVIACCLVFVVLVFVCLVLWLVFASAIYDGEGLN